MEQIPTKEFSYWEKCQLWNLVHISWFYIRYESHNTLKFCRQDI